MDIRFHYAFSFIVWVGDHVYSVFPPRNTLADKSTPPSTAYLAVNACYGLFRANDACHGLPRRPYSSVMTLMLASSAKQVSKQEAQHVLRILRGSTAIQHASQLKLFLQLIAYLKGEGHYAELVYIDAATVRKTILQTAKARYKRDASYTMKAGKIPPFNAALVSFPTQECPIPVIFALADSFHHVAHMSSQLA
eukprot:6175351-Pleurochrysis_carterae.AAC.1